MKTAAALVRSHVTFYKTERNVDRSRSNKDRKPDSRLLKTFPDISAQCEECCFSEGSHNTQDLFSDPPLIIFSMPTSLSVHIINIGKENIPKVQL